MSIYKPEAFVPLDECDNYTMSDKNKCKKGKLHTREFYNDYDKYKKICKTN